MRPNDPARAAPETPAAVRLVDVIDDAAAAGVLESLLRAVADLERRATASERRVLEQDDRIGELQQDNATLAANCEGFQRRVEALQGEVEDLRSAALDLQAEVDSIANPEERAAQRFARAIAMRELRK